MTGDTQLTVSVEDNHQTAELHDARAWIICLIRRKGWTRVRNGKVKQQGREAAELGGGRANAAKTANDGGRGARHQHWEGAPPFSPRVRGSAHLPSVPFAAAFWAAILSASSEDAPCDAFACACFVRLGRVKQK